MGHQFTEHAAALPLLVRRGIVKVIYFEALGFQEIAEFPGESRRGRWLRGNKLIDDEDLHSNKASGKETLCKRALVSRDTLHSRMVAVSIGPLRMLRGVKALDLGRITARKAGGGDVAQDNRSCTDHAAWAHGYPGRNECLSGYPTARLDGDISSYKIELWFPVIMRSGA